MEKQEFGQIRIDGIHVRNYKGIDSLKLEFSKPVYSWGHDINALGSRNGVGKTSVLECCALVLTALQKNFYIDDSLNSENLYSSYIVDVGDYLIGYGKRSCSITGYLTISKKKVCVKITINSLGHPNVKITGLPRQKRTTTNFIGLVEKVSGFLPSPIIENNFIFFHGYRKTTEGGVDPEVLTTSEKYAGLQRRKLKIANPFKSLILRSILFEQNVLEGEDNSGMYQNSKATLNKLISKYVNSRIGKLTFNDQDGKIGIRVQRDNYTFNIDALSSGEKEVVSMMFLTGFFTKSTPSIVLIDEPELHLNTNWHKIFIQDMISSFPSNQYIIATHSSHVLNAIPDEQIHILLKE